MEQRAQRGAEVLQLRRALLPTLRQQALRVERAEAAEEDEQRLKVLVQPRQLADRCKAANEPEDLHVAEHERRRLAHKHHRVLGLGRRAGESGRVAP